MYQKQNNIEKLSLIIYARPKLNTLDMEKFIITNSIIINITKRYLYLNINNTNLKKHNCI